MNRLIGLGLIFVLCFMFWYTVGAYLVGTYNSLQWPWYGSALYILLGTGTFIQVLNTLNKKQ